MIERFNFYDVFGFFIPGSLLVIVLWLPFGVVHHAWPPSDLTSALASVIVSYVIGHFMQAWASRAFPVAENGRNPASRMLDPGNRRLPGPRDLLVELLRVEFGIDVEPAGDSEAERTLADDRREQAFLLARQRLIARRRVGYAEQFEGLYTMMRGLMLASVIGAVYLFGWVANLWIPGAVAKPLLVVVAILALVAMDLRLSDTGLSTPARRGREHRRARVVFILMLAAAAGAGCVFAGLAPPAPADRLLLLALSMGGAAALAIQTSSSYRYYAGEFARAVYRGFLDLQLDREERHDPHERRPRSR